MQISSRTVEAIRGSIQRSRDLPDETLSAATFTLPGVVHAVATASSNRDSSIISNALSHWNSNGHFAAAWRMWNQGNPGSLTDIHGVRTLEFFAFQRRDDQTSVHYQLYQERFVRSLKGVGVPTNLAHAFAGALSEMTDNVVQHSAADAVDRDQGLAGFHVLPGYFSFAVADVGRGILASLLTAPKWKHLTTSEQALSAAVRDHATRRAAHSEGDGFKTLFRSMVDRNCQLRFRTGDALLNFEDAGHSRVAMTQSAPYHPGFQMSCVCAFNGSVGERDL